MLNDVFDEEKRSLPQKRGGYYPIFVLVPNLLPIVFCFTSLRALAIMSPGFTVLRSVMNE